MVCHHLFLLLRQLQPYFHVFFLWHRHTLTHTHTLGVGGWGGAWLVKEAKLDQRPCVREPGYLVENSCPLLSLPLTPAWQQPEIWGLSRPLSWGKRTGQHTYSQNSFCLCSFSLSPWLTRTYKEERKLFVHAQSLIQPQTEIFVSHVHSLCQPHKTIKWSHAWFLFIVCLLNSFISCFSQFGRNLSATLHFPFSLLLSSPPPQTFCELGPPQHCLRVLFFSHTLVSTFRRHMSGTSLPLLCFSSVFKLWQSWERHSAH